MAGFYGVVSRSWYQEFPVIHLALFLLPYVPGWARPWLIGLAIGRRPYRMTEEEAERFETKRENAKVNKALEGEK